MQRHTTSAVSGPRRSRRTAGLGLGLVLGLLVAACGAASSTPRPTAVSLPSPSASASPSTGTTPTPSGRPSPAPSTGDSASGDPSAVRLELAPFVDGLESPLFLTAAGDGSGRLFVLEQAGRIRLVRDGHLEATPFLDISGRVSCCGERGLLGLAFAPGSASTFYVDYTDADGDTVVAAFAVDPAHPDVADPASERVILTIPQPYPNHNGGMLAFGPDGDLYIGMGDGGSGGDPQGNGQDLGALLGKLLRIDVTDPAGNEPYAIPPDNPYVGVADAAPEVWAFGLRNPWRFSFDRSTGDLWIGDVGQGAIEEVDRALAADGGGRGLDYGWNAMEGTHCYPTGEPCELQGMTPPVAEYGHGEGCAVTGGYVYRGSAQPGLAGVYVFGDYCSGRLWGLSSGGRDSQEPVVLGEAGRTIASFGEDEAGELYLVDIDGGSILRLVAHPA